MDLSAISLVLILLHRYKHYEIHHFKLIAAIANNKVSTRKVSQSILFKFGESLNHTVYSTYFGEKTNGFKKMIFHRKKAIRIRPNYPHPILICLIVSKCCHYNFSFRNPPIVDGCNLEPDLYERATTSHAYKPLNEVTFFRRIELDLSTYFSCVNAVGHSTFYSDLV